MLKVISIKCANCGGNLEITPDMEQFACGYCGASQVVQKQGGTISLKLVGDAIKQVQVGTDKTAAELAIKRLSGEMESVSQQVNHNDLLKRQSTSENRKMFLMFWGAIFVFNIFVSGTVGGAFGEEFGGLVFAFFLITGTVIIIYFGFQKHTAISKNFSDKHEILVKHWNNLQAKVAKSA